MPRIWCKSIRHNTSHISGEALVAVRIMEGKRDRVRAVSRNGPVPLFKVSISSEQCQEILPNPNHQAPREEYLFHHSRWEGHGRPRRRSQRSWNNGQMKGLKVGHECTCF
jgi:hypothetical protein